MKSKYHKRASRWLQPGQRQKQNHNREFSLVQQQPYQYMKEDGLILSHQKKILLRTIFLKKVVNLLRHNQTLQREDDGAIEFYKTKFFLRNHHSQIQVWSDDRWKVCLAAGGGSKRRHQYCSDDSGKLLYLRALQGHSGSNLIDPTLQDNVVIGTGIFPNVYHIGCAFNLHSIINNGLIPGGQDLSNRQTVFFLPTDPRDESHKDPEHIDFSVPRLARYVHSAWKRHQYAVFWVDIDLAIREGLTFYQTRSNAIILQGTLPAYCIPKVAKIENWRSLVWKTIFVFSTTTKNLIETRSQWDQREWSIGFYSWTTASWKTRSTVFWRSTTC